MRIRQFDICSIKNSTLDVEHFIESVHFIEQLKFGLRVPAQFCAILVYLLADRTGVIIFPEKLIQSMF